MFLYYDVKGIQSFIFKIPKLKFIVGGSALIDEFDKETVRNLGITGPDLIFSGGGRGMFFCDSVETAQELKKAILIEAKKIGLDIRFGLEEEFSRALSHANELHAFVPEKIPENSEPCPESGLYPVDATLLKNGQITCHEVVEKRWFKSGKETFRRFENKLLEGLSDFEGPGNTLEFFHNVSPTNKDGKAGFEALGSRNRWAVICMDGNDIGGQFRTFLKERRSQEKTVEGIKGMSRELGRITAKSALEGVQKVIRDWGRSHGKEAVCKSGKITLPIRPLLVGGDDIIALCRCDYAVTFVRKVREVFEAESQNSKVPWPATDNGLTISAGVLFTSVTLPLHTAIPYAEALLESAKSLGRERAEARKAPPACIDWEQITESVIDTPDAKRLRELTFYDEEIEKNITLTRRPYTLADFAELEKKAKKYGGTGETAALPRTIRHEIFRGLQQGQAGRLAFAARMKKHHPALFKALNELELKGSEWEADPDGDGLTTDLLDALMLLEEDKRMEKEGM